MTKRMGRPKLPEGSSRETTITLRVKPDERKRIGAAAKRDGLKLSEWIRQTLLKAAGDAPQPKSAPKVPAQTSLRYGTITLLAPIPMPRKDYEFLKRYVETVLEDE